MQPRGAVFIIDDNVAFTDELREMLRLSGYETLVSNDSVAAAAQVKRSQPGVVLLDMKMEEKDGATVAAELRRDPATSAIPIVALSGYYPAAGLPAAEHCAGIDAFVSKAAPPEVILNVIAERLRRGPLTCAESCKRHP